MEREKIYLLFLAAHRPVFPLLPTEMYKLLPDSLIRLMGQSIVRTRQLTAKEGLLPTVASNSTPASLVDLCQRSLGETGYTAEGCQCSSGGEPHRRDLQTVSRRAKAACQPRLVCIYVTSSTHSAVPPARPPFW